MKTIACLSAWVSISLFHCHCGGRVEGPDIEVPKISIECTLVDGFNSRPLPNPLHKDLGTIFWMAINEVALGAKWIPESQHISQKKIKWELHSNKMVYIRTAFQRGGLLLYPGDSIAMSYGRTGVSFAGRGAESARLQYEIERAQQSIEQPAQSFVFIKSPEEYLLWSNYLDRKAKAGLFLLDSAKDAIRPEVYDRMRESIIYNAELDRAEAFMGLNTSRLNSNTTTLSVDALSAICDSTLDGVDAKWLRSLVEWPTSTWYFYQYNRIQVWKRFHFNIQDDSLNSDMKRRVLYYATLKNNYKGMLRERLLQYVIADEAIKEIGFNNPITDSLLDDYYKQPGFPEFKDWMRRYADSLRRKQGLAKK